ncbi:MAG: cytochrome c3 family protein [Candidatus Hydrothermales bacterium]
MLIVTWTLINIHILKKKRICFNCHEDVLIFFYKSDHYEHLECYSCHGSHNLLSFKFPGSKIIISEKCTHCHFKEGKEYKESIHFLALKRGLKEAPSCIDCHSEHFILYSEKKESPIYFKNVPKTCANCHENKAITEKYGLPPKRYETYISSYRTLLRTGLLKISKLCFLS